MSRRPFLQVLPLVGGAASAAGVVLPWVTFYAGLQSMNGLQGTKGQLLLGASALVVFVAVAHFRRPGRWTLLPLVGMGAALAIASGLLLVQAQQLASSPAVLMLVPRVGPGLWISLAGASLVVIGSMMSKNCSYTAP